MLKARQKFNNSNNKIPKKNTPSHLNNVLEDINFVVFDLETTGGNPQKNGLTEIFAIKFCLNKDVSKTNPKDFETFHSLVNPQMRVPPIVRRMTGIDNNMLVDAPVVQDIFPQFLDFVGDACIVSHNVQGDLKFLKHFALQTAKKNLQNFFLCTHLLVEKLVPEAPVKSVKGLAQFFELGNKNFHRAEADAFVTLEIFKILLVRLQSKSIKTLEDALRFQNDKENLAKIGWSVPEKSLENLPNTPGLFKLFDRERKLLFAASSFSIQKDIARLQRSDQVPKPLAKVVLKTNDIQFDRYSNLFEAMLAEVELVTSSHKTVLDPTVWHQRNLYFLCFSEVQHENSDSQIELEICPLKPGIIGALGPVYDRARTFSDLEKLARELQLVRRKESILIPHELVAEVKQRLTQQQATNNPIGQMIKFLSDISRKILQIFNNSRSRQPLQIGSTSQPAKFKSYEDIFTLSGLLAISCNSIGGFKIFPVAQGLPLDPISVRGANRENLQKNLLINLKTQGTYEDLLNTFESGPDLNCLSESEAKKMSVIQWWIQSQAQDGLVKDENLKKDASSLFISAAELARIEMNESRRN